MTTIQTPTSKIPFPYAQTADAMESWIRKFERELQQILTGDFSPCNACTPETHGDCRICIKDLLKEK